MTHTRTDAQRALDSLIRVFSKELIHDEHDPRDQWGEGRTGQRLDVLGEPASRLAGDIHRALRALERDPAVQTSEDADAATERLARTLETQYDTSDAHVRHALATLSATNARVDWADVDAHGEGVVVRFGDLCWANMTRAETRQVIAALRAQTPTFVVAEHEHEVSATSLHCVTSDHTATLCVGRLVDFHAVSEVTCQLNPQERARFADRLETALGRAA